MAYDLTKATLARTGSGHDLTKATQTPKATGRTTFSQTAVRQSPATSRAHPLAKGARSSPGTPKGKKAVAARAKKKGG